MSRDLNRKFEYKLTKTYTQIVNFILNPDKLIPKSDMDPAMQWIDFSGSEHLTHLIQFTYNDFMKKHEKVLILFFDSSSKFFLIKKIFNFKLFTECEEEFCNIMKEEFAETAKVSTAMEFNIKLATIDIQTQKSLRKEQGADEEGNSIFYYE